MLLPPSFSLLFPPIPKKELHHFSPLRYNSPLPFSWVLIQKSTLLFAVFRFFYSAGPGSPPSANVFKLPLTVQTTCQSHLPRTTPHCPQTSVPPLPFPSEESNLYFLHLHYHSIHCSSFYPSSLYGQQKAASTSSLSSLCQDFSPGYSLSSLRCVALPTIPC